MGYLDDIDEDLVPYVNLAIEKARNSNMMHRHGAVVVEDDRVVSKACNVRLRSRGTERQKEAGECSLHAEERALDKLPPDFDPTHSFLVVIRLTQGGNIKNSKPCGKCQKKIEKAGIPLVYYSS